MSKRNDMTAKKRKPSKKQPADSAAAEKPRPSAGGTELDGSPTPEPAEAAADPKVDAPLAGGGLLEAKAALEAELEELKDRHLRLAAEFDNFRKRTTRESARRADLAQAELVRELLESLDDLTRVSQLGSSGDDAAAAILEGVRLVEKKLRAALESCGLRPIEAAGQQFDPELHEALVTVPAKDPGEDDLVSQELLKGYIFKQTLLRPSRVEVKKYRPAASAGGDGAGGSEVES